MIKSILASVLIHIFVIGVVLFILPKSKKEPALDVTKVSLKFVSLKYEPKIEHTKKSLIKKKVTKKIVTEKKVLVEKKSKSIVVKSKKKSIKQRRKITKVKKTLTTKRVSKARVIKKSKKRVKRRSSLRDISKNRKKRIKKEHKLSSKAKEFSSKKFLKVNKNRIYQAIQRAKSYPRIAKRLKIEGIVRVRFTILPSGRAVDIITSSANRVLQKSARDTIIKASANFPKPKKSVDVGLNISYKL